MQQDLLAVRLDRHCRRRAAPEISERQAQALARLRRLAAELGALFPLLEWG